MASAIGTLLAYCFCLGVLIYYYWLRWRAGKSDRKFNYTIPELWAVAVGLAPTMLSIAYAQRHFDAAGAVENIGIVLVCQLSGMLLFKLTAESNSRRFMPWVEVLLGALFGLYLVPMIAVLLIVLCVVLIVGGIGAPVAVPAIWIWHRRRHRRQKMWEGPQSRLQ